MNVSKMFSGKRKFGLRSAIALCVALAATVSAMSHPAKAAVYTYPAAAFPASGDYTVSAGGQSIAVNRIDLTDGAGVYSPKSQAGFGFDNSVSVTVTPNFSFSSFAVRPDQYGISASRSGNSITFTLSDNTKGKVIVEFDNDYNKSLFLFADGPIPAVPSGATYYGPGSYTTDLNLSNNQTIYLAPGAVVTGDINMKYISNAKVIGRGWLLGSLWTDNASNCEVSGIQMAQRGKWTVNLLDSSYFTIRDVKLMYLASETDGFSFNGTGNSSVTNSFIMNGDDVFTSQRPGCKDNLTQNIVVWSTGGGNIFGPGGTEDIGGNNVYRDIYIVRGKNNFLTHHWSNGPKNIGGYTFENVYADPRVPFQSFIYFNDITNPGTRYYTLKNIYVPFAPSRIDGSNMNFTFDNVVLGGTKMTSTSQMQLNNLGSNNTFTFTSGSGGGSAPIGQVISIWSPSANSFVSTREDSSGYGYNPLIAMAPSVNAWERYRIDNANDGYIALWSVNRGRYVSVDNNLSDRILRAEWATGIGDWEKFTWEGRGGNKFALKSKSPGFYVSADLNPGGNGWLKAVWASNVGAWEEFNWDPQCLTGTYFDNADFTGSTRTRRDPIVNFNWGTGSPISGIAPPTFSTRWTGRIIPQYSQAYTFFVNADNNVRLWVNGTQVINSWTGASGERRSTTINLTAKQLYSIRLDYTHNVGNAYAQLSWQSSSQVKQIIPDEATLPN